MGDTPAYEALEYDDDSEDENQRTVLEEPPLGSDDDVSDSDSDEPLLNTVRGRLERDVGGQWDGGASHQVHGGRGAVRGHGARRARGAGRSRGARHSRGAGRVRGSQRGRGSGRGRGVGCPRDTQGRRGRVGGVRGHGTDQSQETVGEERDDGWVEAGRIPHIRRFSENPGPKGNAEDLGEARPIDLFLNFFDENLLNHLVVETNRYAAQCPGLHPYYGPCPRYIYLYTILSLIFSPVTFACDGNYLS